MRPRLRLPLPPAAPIPRLALLLALLLPLRLASPAAATPEDPPPTPAPAPAPAPAPVPAPVPAPDPGAPATGAPSLVAEPAEVDLGTAAQNQDLSAEVTLRNAGAHPVHIVKPITDCGCYVATLSEHDLAPGQSVTLRITFHTLTWSGPLTKRLRVASNDPVRGELVVPIKVNIAAGVVLDPGRFTFGDVLRGEKPSKTLLAKWHEAHGKPFRVLGVSVPQAPDAFDVVEAPYEQGPWKGTKLTLTFREPPPLGMYSAVALIRTDAPGHERLEVPLQAFVSGLVWVQERSVDLGWVRQGQTKTRRLSVRPFRKGIDLGKVTARARDGRVQVEVAPDGSDRPGWWVVNVIVPASLPKGAVRDVVEVGTEVKGEELTEVQVKAEIL